MILSAQFLSSMAMTAIQAPQFILAAASTTVSATASATASASATATPSLPAVVPASPTPTAVPSSTAATATAVNFPTILFSLLIWGAVLFAVVIVLLPDRTREQRTRIKALGVAGASAALFFALWAVETQASNAAIGLGGRPGGELMEQRRWLASFPISASYHLDADGLSLGLILLTTVVFFCVAVAVWRNDRHVKLLSIALLTLETAFLGVLCSYDWVLFLIFWSLPIAPVYLLIRTFGGGGEHSSRVAMRYAVTALVSTGLLAVAALLIGFEDGTRSFDMGLAPLTLPATVSHVVFWLCTGAFLIAMAVVPLHIPLLDLEEDSSGALSAVFAALLPTLGAYGLLHVSVGFFPTISGEYSLLFAVLAVISVAWAGIAAVRTDDLRRLVGHVGTVQMGAVLLAVAGHTTLAITGAIFLLLSRGLTVSVLMLVSSLIQERTRRVRISQIAGLAWQTPRLAAFWLGAALSAAGTPLLSGFVAYLLLFSGAFPAHRWFTVLVLVGVLVTPVALLWAARRMFLGASRETFSKARDVGPFEMTYLLVLLAVIVLLGVLPEHFADLFNNGASSILFPGDKRLMTNVNGHALVATLLPPVLLLLTAAAVALLGWRRPGLPAGFYRWLTCIGLAGAAGGALVTLSGLTKTQGLGLVTLSGAVVGDRFAVYAELLLCAVAVLGVLGAGTAQQRLHRRAPAFHALVLTATAGGTIIAIQWEMAMFLAGAGLLLLSLTGMVALEKTVPAAGEAALKQLAGGGVAFAVLAYGLAIVFGATGTTDLEATRGLFVHAAGLEGLGLAMTLLGLCYLIGATPLHLWLLQVIRGSSGGVAAVVVSLGVTAGAIALVRVMVSGFSDSLRPWVILAAVLAAIACLYPAVSALAASDVRRLIGLGVSLQGGLLLTALLGTGVGGDHRLAGGVAAILFGSTVFALASLASLQAVGLLEAQGIGTRITELRGLSRRAPGTTALLCLGLAGLAGLPPLAGFIARLLVAESAVAGGFAWVAVVSLAAWLLYAIPVLRCLAVLFVEDDDAPAAAPAGYRLARLVATCCAVFGILASVLAGPMLYAANGAALSLH